MQELPSNIGGARVAVVIPCFDAGSVLCESVASASAQTYPDVEIIVVDDGSSDAATLRALNEVGARERVIVLRQPNRGPAAARNTGIAATTADFILPLDADDLIEPPYIAEAVAVLSARPEVRMVYCRADFFGDVTGPWGLPDFNWPGILVHNQIFCSHLFRRNDWASVGGYDEDIRRGREDHDFVLKLLALGGQPHRLDEVYFHYRRSAGTVNATFGSDRELLIQTSARMLRNNQHLYFRHAEDLFRYIFAQQDALTDMQHRYASLESLRLRFPKFTRALRAPVKLTRTAGRAARSARWFSALQQLKHRLFIARKRTIQTLERAWTKAVDLVLIVRGLLRPYRFNPAAYPGEFVVRNAPTKIDPTADVPLRLTAFWLGGTPMSTNRERGIASMHRLNPHIDIQLVTDQSLASIIHPAYPLHPAFQFLALTHRSDYLRCYIMHLYGGGYSDVKHIPRSWEPAFERLRRQPAAWALGYRELSHTTGTNLSGRVQDDLRNNFFRVIGNGAFIMRPGTPLTWEWFQELNRRLDGWAADLERWPGGVRGGEEGGNYPVPKHGLLGDILGPLALKYYRHLIIDESVRPDFHDYI